MSRLRKILNLVDGVTSVNYGIWHAAIASSEALAIQFGIESWLVSPEFDESFSQEQFPWLSVHTLNSVSAHSAKEFLKNFNPAETIIASHGCWQYPTRWGSIAQQLGFAWVYTPHGMLEPWSMSQKAWKKQIYFHLIEKRLTRKATVIRAVGKPEWQNLMNGFHKVVHIPNGIYERDLTFRDRIPTETAEYRFLFLARLHFKKNIIPLVKAWINSSLADKPGFVLQIAGTDDGEKAELEQLIKAHPDCGIVFLGPVFGAQKRQLLAASDFYILPSLSEGFPTSVVEAAGAGLICLISEGCNFPELLKEGLALNSGCSLSAITAVLEKASELSAGQRNKITEAAGCLVEAEFTWEKIAARQAREYGQLLS